MTICVEPLHIFPSVISEYEAMVDVNIQLAACWCCIRSEVERAKFPKLKSPLAFVTCNMSTEQ